MAAPGRDFSNNVFINCPFDADYWPMFEAMIFTIVDSGFIPRCALEEPDSGEARVRRLERIVESSRYSIHDISRVQLSPRYPRFNMPFELGLDLGCRRYGDAHLRRKRCLILDSERYRYQEFFSDIAGQDIKAHENDPDTVVKLVRDWLKAVSRRTTIPGPALIRRHFFNFTTVLPQFCDNLDLDRNEIQFAEYVTMAEEWLNSADE